MAYDRAVSEGRDSERDRIEAVEAVRVVVSALAGELAPADADAARRLALAASFSATPQEELLVMREALVVTRPDWERAGVDSAAAARRALRDAKRLAIEL